MSRVETASITSLLTKKPHALQQVGNSRDFVMRLRRRVLMFRVKTEPFSWTTRSFAHFTIEWQWLRRNTMDDFDKYQKAQADSRAAYERLNYASVALENAHIKERLAKIKSQQEPLAGLMAQKLSERDRLYAAAFYVVIGRFPNDP